MPNIYFYMALIFSVSLMGWFLGGQSEFMSGVQKYEESPTVYTILDQVLSNILSWQGAFTTAAIIGVALFTGGNLAVVVPFALGMILMNFIIFPASFFDPLSGNIKIALSAFFTFSAFVVVMAYIR